jgi:hypothetical protein
MTDALDELFEERMKIIDTRLKLNKLIALNLQLFNAVVAYAKLNDIPLPFNPKIMSLIEKIEKEDPDINVNYGLSSTDSLQRNKSTEDLPECV